MGGKGFAELLSREVSLWLRKAEKPCCRVLIPVWPAPDRSSFPFGVQLQGPEEEAPSGCLPLFYYTGPSLSSGCMSGRVFRKRHFMEVEQAQPPIQVLGVDTGWTTTLATP
jgi:hypothetical protein